jgi:RNA polymerase sigma-70 factor (ECF subfamily)
MVAHSQATLLERARKGDRGAFEALFVPLHLDAFRLALAMLQRREEAEDAVQEALFKAWRKLDTFRVGSDVRPWFLTIVANECRSLRRTRWWGTLRVAEPTSKGQEWEGATPEQLDLRRTLAALPPDQRLLLVLRYYLDLPFEEMAQIVGSTPDGVKSKTFRVLRKLRVANEAVEVTVT